jgi:hypothetical protein
LLDPFVASMLIKKYHGDISSARRRDRTCACPLGAGCLIKRLLLYFHKYLFDGIPQELI